MATRILRLVSQYSEKCYNAGGRKFSSLPLNPIPGLSAFNSLSKKKTPVLTKQPNVLTWYICGPTVYDLSHIGHAWCYVNFDIMRRVMQQYFNVNVIQVMNITDIDDKIIQKAIDEKLDFKEVSSKYEMAFLNDMDSLSVEKPTLLTKVSDFIPQIICFIETLLHRELAYATDDGSVYFDLNAYVKKYKYGKLKPSRITTVDSTRGKSSEDFALWKAAKSDTEPSWMPSWGGKGRPGWHIECSVMASHIFGRWVDVHSGGIDLLFPHHENEEAQCCAYHETPQWVGHWIHSNLLQLSGGMKMSKSLKNTVSIREFLQTHSADQFRMMCLLSNYRNEMEFTEASLNLAKDFLDIVRLFATECSFLLRNNSLFQSSIDSELLLTTLVETESIVKSYLGDDFNTAQATNAVRKLILLTRREINNSNTKDQKATGHNPGIAAVASILNFVSKYFGDLGITLPGNPRKDTGMDTSSIIDNFVKFRGQVRQCALSMKSNQHQKKDDPTETANTRKILLTACDRIREDLKLKGIQLKDQEKNASWTLVK